MPRIDEATDGPLPTTLDATATSFEGGRADLAEMARRLAPHVARSPSRHRVMADLRGLLREAERQNSWQVAEACGDPNPDGFPYVLNRADRDAEAVRDALRTSVIQPLEDPHGVLVLDETGLVNKGRHSAGVARPYTGTVGQVENGHIGVFLGSASPLGQALVDRELSLPQAWTNDRERCRQAGIPEDRGVATQPQLARQMLARACAAGVPAPWVTGDGVDGDNRGLRRWLEARPQASVLAVSGQAYVWVGGPQRPVNTILAALPEESWTRLSAGHGTKGPRWYDWRWRPLAQSSEPGWRRWLLVRRRVSTPTELQASVVFAPQATTLAAVVRVAGSRWTLESGFEAAKGDVGLDHDDVRTWTGWYRPLTLAMWALALLTIMRAGTSAVEAFNKSRWSPREASPLAAFQARHDVPSR
jgi:SRSO17 transposase